ncbi:RHS repeat-associated core domain-containing protein [Pseudomonas silesiensis]|uniref:RHS repeat-associated core domain-containing protein n=1 Tax=Pseudomonas silesiensis TaxID=1853130 RepID=UPI0030DCE577
MTATVHANTPQLSVIDSRGLAVRHVAYCRRENTGVIPQARITRQLHDAVGHLLMLRDPRLQAPDARPNMTTIYGLSGGTLITDSIDAGWRLRLYGEAGTAQEAWDGRGSHWRHEHDDQQRPVATHEQAKGSIPRNIERLTYASNSVDFAERNQCGQLIRHDHSAGVVWFEQRALNGGSLRELQRFLPDLADVQADWPGLEADRDQLLQPGAGYTTQRHYGPTSDVLVQTDAGGHRQHFSIDRAGQLQRIDLTLAQQTLQPLLKAASYNAEGQLLEQVTGNDVVNTATYEPSTSRLQRLIATSADRQLQSLSYEYDPVGNIVQLVDHTQPDTFFSNQRVAALNSYTYDSLYQLVCATGRETAGAGQTPGLPELIVPSPIDPGRLLNYSEYYEYDAGGNRTELRHVSDTNPFRHLMRVDPISNRALPWSEGEEQPDFERNFDANGNLQYLLPGTQPMNWDARNQLQSVTTVRRTTGTDDGEWYRYNAAGERVVKFSIHQARTVTHKRVVHYLPGLEVRTGDNGEELQVIVIALARGNVRCRHWARSKPKDIEDDPLRYSVDDHLGSCSLELDRHANVISHEGYYPYGGTAWWAARSAVDADYKTIRYSGKEQDACGLYYYGFRYLAPWLGRWINPDPAGNIDGLNFYTMVGNNPIVHKDPTGLEETPINKDIHMIWIGADPDKLKPHIGNINNTVEQAGGYKVHLYLDAYSEGPYQNTIEELRVHDTISLRRDSDLFNNFQETPQATIYNDFRTGQSKNFAFAADVLRAYIVEQKGGMYSDVDDVYLAKSRFGLSEQPLTARPDELLTLPPVVVPWEDINSPDSVQIGNSSFAAHPGNPILREAMKEMHVRYNDVVESGLFSDKQNHIGAGILKNADDRMGLMSKMVGPGVLTDVIKQHDAFTGDMLSGFHAMYLKSHRHPGSKLTRAESDLLFTARQQMPLGSIIKPGNLHSWK